MGFQLVPKSMTLNDLERRNDRYLIKEAMYARKEGQQLNKPWIVTRAAIKTQPYGYDRFLDTTAQYLRKIKS